jgi:hypothetical protein
MAARVVELLDPGKGSVPDKGPRNCLDPERPGTSPGAGSVRGEGQAGAGPSPPNMCGSSSRDPARMEET